MTAKIISDNPSCLTVGKKCYKGAVYLHENSSDHITLWHTVFNHCFFYCHHCSQHFAMTWVMSGFGIATLLYIWFLFNYYLTLILNLDSAAAFDFCSFGFSDIISSWNVPLQNQMVSVTEFVLSPIFVLLYRCYPFYSVCYHNFG